LSLVFEEKQRLIDLFKHFLFAGPSFLLRKNASGDMILGHFAGTAGPIPDRTPHLEHFSFSQEIEIFFCG
jgi:hypothetical protein